MFWPGPGKDGDHWQQCDDETEAYAIVHQIDKQALGEGSPRQRHLTYGATPSAETLNVTRVLRRELCFYEPEENSKGEPNPWCLYLLECDATEIDDLVGYEDVAIFAVNKQEPEEGCWTIIDWKSPTIYSLNGPLDLSNDDKKIEYLRFFCSFIGGDSDIGGIAAPFMLPRFEQMGWGDAWEVLERVKSADKWRFFAAPDGANRSDPFDTDRQESTTKATSAEEAILAREIHHVLSKEDIQSNVEEIIGKGNPSTQSLDTDIFKRLKGGETAENGDPRKSEAKESNGPLFGAVWYNGGFFAATFSISKKGETQGVVTMEDDAPIPGAANLPLPRYLVVTSKITPLPLLVRQKPKEEIGPAELEERMLQAGSANGARAPRLRGLRVKGAFKTSKRFASPVRLEDVDFTDEVVLDDAVFDRSLTFDGCAFLQHLSARTLTVGGAVRLNDSRFLGTVRRESSGGGMGSRRRREPSVLELRGASIGRGLFADRLQALGRVRAEWVRRGSLQGAWSADLSTSHNR